MEQNNEKSFLKSWYFLIYRVNSNIEEILEAFTKIKQISSLKIRISDYRKKEFEGNYRIFMDILMKYLNRV